MTYNRILIKISGETISGSREDGAFDLDAVLAICKNIKNVIDAGISVSIVVGGGNIIRGRAFSNSKEIRKETADSMGMLSTTINGLLLKDIFKSIGINSVLVSNIKLPFNIESADHSNVSKLIEKNKVIIFVAGTGLPYFSTDTASIISALVSRSDVVLKATKTDGIYDKDPEKYPEAKHIEEINYDEALNANIQIMDQTAFALAKANNLPILVFSIKEDNCFIRALKGEIKHSVVSRSL